MVNTFVNGTEHLLTAIGWDNGEFTLLEQELKARRGITSGGTHLPPWFIV